MANLTQLRMLENLDGFLLVDKPAGIAFASVVKAVKRTFNLVKVGHGGSLDAMASGLFILLVGDANKFTADVMGADRAYTGTMRLGLKTTTHDVYGETVGETASLEGLDVLELLGKHIPEFKGDLFQTEPRFSTIRKEGTSGYEIADTGEHSQFLTHVYRLQPTTVDGPRVGFEISGTKSLLVRTLVNDLGDALGCGAALESLRRTKVGRFSVDDAVPFDRLLTTEMKDFASCVLPMSAALR